MVAVFIALMDPQNAYLYTTLVVLRWVIILFPEFPLYGILIDYWPFQKYDILKSKENDRR